MKYLLLLFLVGCTNNPVVRENELAARVSHFCSMRAYDRLNIIPYKVAYEECMFDFNYLNVK